MLTTNKKTREIDNQEDYKNEYKSMMDDAERTKTALESVPQIPKEQVPSGDETTKELLEGSAENKKKAEEHIAK